MSKELLKLNETTDDQLVIIREFNAPKSLVFAALTQHQHIKKWSCPKGMMVTFSEGELEVGKTYRFGMKSESKPGPEMILTGVYREIKEPHKLVYTQVYEMPDGNKSPETVIHVTLEENEGKTQMIFHHKGFASKEGRDNASKGWPSAFDKLTQVINSLV